MDGDDISLAEGVGGPLQHQERPVIGRRQGRADAITPHKHHSWGEKVGGDGGGAGSWSCSAVVRWRGQATVDSGSEAGDELFSGHIAVGSDQLAREYQLGTIQKLRQRNRRRLLGGGPDVEENPWQMQEPVGGRRAGSKGVLKGVV
jgi:hypothetical protein